MSKFSEDSFDEQLAIHQAVLSTAVDAIITIDSRGIVRQANEAVSKLFQYSLDEIIGSNVSMLMASPEREEHDSYLENYLRTGEAKIIGIGRELIARRKDGSGIHIDLAVSEVNVGEQRLFTGIIRDMTSRKMAEETAERERVFADSLLDTANSAVVVLDVNAKIARINRFLEELSGYESAEVRGQEWFSVFLREEIRDRQRQLFQDVLQGDSVESNIHAIELRSGESRIFTWSACALHNADEVREGALLIGSDITDLKRTESRLIERERLAAIGQMVTGLAHESRNALQRAQAALDVLELDAEGPSLRLVTQTQGALGELQRLYDEVRNYAAPIRLEANSVDIDRLCRKTWDQVVEVHSNQYVQLNVMNRLQNNFIRCDPNRITQVLRNVFENALAVSPEYGVVRVDLAEINNQSAIQLTVYEEGPGLNEEQEAKIFTPFYTTKTKGTGLGMAICERIIKAHDGEIKAGNQSERSGAIVSIRLPRQAQKE